MNDSTFQREDRYIVIKRSDLEKVPVGYWSSLIEPIGALQAHLPHRECLVIESDWPEYEPVWQMIERRMAGQPPVTAAEELEAVLHWRDKHAVAIKERDALQALLTAAETKIAEFPTILFESCNFRGLNSDGSQAFEFTGGFPNRIKSIRMVGWVCEGPRKAVELQVSYPAESRPAEVERNQCDGCQAGIPVVNGAHRMGKPGGYADTMSCTAKLYKPAEGGGDEAVNEG